jgi:SAM-dependent methyltransferase
MSLLYEKIMGAAWVYDVLRPALLGGFDFSSVYRRLECSPTDVIVDVGCGTGHAMQYLKRFQAYHGFDSDERALRAFQRKHAAANISLYGRIMEPRDTLQLRPTKAVLMGLLHHISDAEVRDLLQTLGGPGTVQRVITLDPVYVRGRWASNLLARMDRGGHVRDVAGYRAIIEGAPFKVCDCELLTSGNGLATYLTTCMSAATADCI